MFAVRIALQGGGVCSHHPYRRRARDKYAMGNSFYFLLHYSKAYKFVPIGMQCFFGRLIVHDKGHKLKRADTSLPGLHCAVGRHSLSGANDNNAGD